MSELARELRFAARGLARTKAFTAVTLLTVALGVGANTAIFSIVHGVLLRPLPFREPERLVTLWEIRPRRHGSSAPVANHRSELLRLGGTGADPRAHGDLRIRGHELDG